MEYTTNLNLKKPDVNEYYNVEQNNENMDLIDEAVGELNKKITVKTKELDMTSDSGGNVNISASSDIPYDAKILSLDVINGDSCAIPFKLNGLWYAKVLNTDSPMVVLTNKTISLMVEYLEL